MRLKLRRLHNPGPLAHEWALEVQVTRNRLYLVRLIVQPFVR